MRKYFYDSTFEKIGANMGKLEEVLGAKNHKKDYETEQILILTKAMTAT